MKTIKKITLKKATKLSFDEMKHVFGGSSTTEDGSGCYLVCGDSIILSTQLPGCNICATSGGKMFCKSTPDSAGYPVTCDSGTTNE